MSLLSLQNIGLRFGGLVALNEVELNVQSGQIYSVIGPNGAGKTSLFNVVTGIYEPTSGSIKLNGRDIRLPFGAKAISGVFIIALLSGIALLLAIKIELLWEKVISENYVYQEPFLWSNVWSGLLSFVLNTSLNYTLLPFIIGFTIGLAAAFIIWQRSRRTPDVVARNGVSRTFQNIRLFPEMTVRENILVGMELRLKCGFWAALLRLPSYYLEQKSAEERAIKILEFVGLSEKIEELSSSLPYGHQRRLEIGRALASEPKLLLLDEPAAGMNPTEAEELMELIRAIRDSGITVLLIEHHMRVVMGISDRIAVLDHGEKIAEGTPSEIKSNPQVIEAYLGKA